MNIFITGASGFIGKELVQALSEDTAVDNLFVLYREKEQIPFIPKVNPILGDLEKLPEIKTDAEINVLVHLAGYYKTESKALCENVNVQGTKNVLEFCKTNNIPKILFFSTINVDLKPKGCYATSKLAAEKEIWDSGLDYMI
nr:NAD(P)-dependent oxidoreductase [Thermoclostridium sp.]